MKRPLAANLTEEGMLGFGASRQLYTFEGNDTRPPARKRKSKVTSPETFENFGSEPSNGRFERHCSYWLGEC